MVLRYLNILHVFTTCALERLTWTKKLPLYTKALGTCFKLEAKPRDIVIGSERKSWPIQGRNQCLEVMKGLPAGVVRCLHSKPFSYRERTAKRRGVSPSDVSSIASVMGEEALP